MNVTAGVLQKLLAALNECTEWVSRVDGQLCLFMYIK